ncbi:MAG TPA: Fic family protein [Albidovulum sp.]|uniref:Fic family protein n=1 Tax=Albidovulum sp. TaxID=1872424 RepID=UPI002B5CF9D0|nr:Fic family protein [Albidovulum sp.]
MTENHIRQLHRDLLRRSGKGERHRGAWNTSANSIAAFDETGQQIGIVFETASPFDTPARMTGLVDWYNAARADGTLHPLLLIGIFVVVLLEIHPFQDGNGRLSRALTTLLLVRAGYAYVPYASLESLIKKSKEACYLALLRQMRRLRDKVERERLMMGSLPEVSAKLLDFVRDHGRLTIGDAERLTGENRNTLKLHFRALVGDGHFVLNGAGRGAWYSLG